MASNKSSSTSRVVLVVQESTADGSMGQQNVQDVTLYQAVISSPRVLGLCPAFDAMPKSTRTGCVFCFVNKDNSCWLFADDWR